MKPCTVCNLEKPRNLFREDLRLKSKHASACRECEALRAKSWKKNNPEKVKKTVRNWLDRNKELNSKTHLAWLKKNANRAKAHSCNAIAKRRIGCEPIETDLLVELFNRALGRCGYCNKRKKQLGFDHMTPLCLGGEHKINNLIVACGDCNRKKNRKTSGAFTSLLRQTE